MRGMTAIRSVGGLMLAAAFLVGCSAILPINPGSAGGVDAAPSAASQALVIEGCGVVEDFSLPPTPGRSGRGGGPADRELISNAPALTLTTAHASDHLRRVPGLIDGLELKGLSGDSTRVLAYFTRGSYSRDMTRAEFLRDGGFILSQTIPGRPDLAAVVIDEIGDRATEIAIGPHTGAITHGDFVSEGLRPYGLWWSDEDSEWSLIAGAKDPTTVVNFARAVACRG